jgi:hypothetical protein
MSFRKIVSLLAAVGLWPLALSMLDYGKRSSGGFGEAVG